MKYPVSDYIFDTERLIFYRPSLDEDTLSAIESAIPVNGRYEVLSAYISGFNPDEMSTKRIFPYEGGICLTYKCQLRCNYCSFRSQEENQLTLTEADIRAYAAYLMKNIALRKLVNGQPKKLHLYFSGGGEPTYHKELFKTAVLALEDECSKNDVELALDLTTNGMISTSMIDFIADHFNSVMVSFDGMPYTQNKNRKAGNGADTAERVVKTIKEFGERSDRIITTVRTTLWHPDIPLLNEIAIFIYETFPKLKGWSVLPIIATGRAADCADSSIFNTEEYDFVTPYFEVKQMVREKYGKDNISSPMFLNDCSNIFCGQLQPSAGWLMPGGNVITCLESKEHSSVIANVRDGVVRVPQTYKSSLVKTYKEKFTQCRNCLAYRFCKGGCPLKFMYDGEASGDAIAWECESKRNYWKYIFRKILAGETFMGWSVQQNPDFTDVEVLHLVKGGKMK